MAKTEENITPWGPIGFITFLRTYSRRRNDDSGDTEEFPETIKRVVDACRTQLKVGFTEEEEKEVTDMMLNLKGIVAGRFLWQLGTRTVKKLGLFSLQNCCFCVVDEPIRPFTWTMDALMLGAGVGYNIQKEHVYQLPKVKSKIKIERKDNADADYIVPDSREGWVKLLSKVLKAHFYSGEGFTYSTQLIRGKGAPIKGFGGVASGPEELCWGIQKIHDILNSRSNQKLHPVDCLDILNIIGAVVVSGNVRRCLPEGSLVQTKRGLVPIEKVSPNTDEVLTYDGSFCRVLANFKQGKNVTAIIELTNGDSFECTFNHKMAVHTEYGSYIWKQAKEIVKGDCLLKNQNFYDNEITYTIPNNLPAEVKEVRFGARTVETYDIEVEDKHEFYANGYLTHNSAQIAIGDHDDLDFLKAKRWDLGNVPNWRVNSNNSVICDDTSKLSTEFWETYNQGEPYGIINLPLAQSCGRLGETQYPDNCEGFNPCQPSFAPVITKEGLKTFADISEGSEIWSKEGWTTVTKKWSTGVKPVYAFTATVAGPVFIGTQNHKIETVSGKVEVKTANSFLYLKGPAETPYEAFGYNDKEFISAFGRKTYLGDHEVFDITVDNESHTYWTGGLSVSNCAEQGLANNEVCCLAEIFLPNINSKKELLKIAKYLYRICKHSLSLPCHHKETKEIVAKNMRMGIGVTGFLMASAEQKAWLKDVYEKLREYDVEYSAEHGWPTSIKLTTIKPSGTLSLLAGVTPGIHPSPAGPYYIRRIRIASGSPLIQTCREHGYPIEPVKHLDGTDDYNTFVVSFPCHVPEDTPIAGELSAVEHLEIIKWAQENWSDNSISCTVSYTKEELPEIKEWLNNNFSHSLKTVSFLLVSGHGFSQAPYETISKEEYTNMSLGTREITDASFNESDIDSVDECAGGACPIK